MEVALARFRAGLTPTSELTNAESSRDALVSRFLRAVSNNDSADLRRIVLDQAEYAWLYFPSSPYMRKPYALPPDIAWSLNVQNSEKGLSRLLSRLGGYRLKPGLMSCGDSVVEGPNTFWKECTIEHTRPESSESSERYSRRLFGAIMRRDNGFKFLSYANDF